MLHTLISVFVTLLDKGYSIWYHLIEVRLRTLLSISYKEVYQVSVETTKVPDKTKRLLVTLPVATYAMLEQCSTESGFNKSKIITDAIFYFVTRIYGQVKNIKDGKTTNDELEFLNTVKGLLAMRAEREGKR